jgi:hypothetical protein
MGRLKYPHMPLLLESMRWNSMIRYTLINVIEDGSDQANEISELKRSMNVDNFHIKIVDQSQFKAVVEQKLNIVLDGFDSTWYYKLCDFKPALAYLFPDIVRSTDKFWGYGDMDVIWGNVTRFAYLFEGSYPIVISGPLH